jgi:F-type H+-transporting ATPase subunit b
MADKATTGAATATKAGTVVPADGHKKVFPPLDSSTFASQFFWLAVTFALLYYLLSRMALPRIGEVIEERRDRIQRDLDEAARLKDETAKALASYEQAMADARGKAQSIAADTRTRLTSEVEKERGRVEAQIAAKIADTEQRIESTKTTALERVNEIVVDTAGAIVNKLVGVEVSADDVRRHLQAAPRT